MLVEPKYHHIPDPLFQINLSFFQLKDENIYFDRYNFVKNNVEREYYNSGADVIEKFENLVKVELEYIEFIDDPGDNVYKNYLNRLDREKRLFFKN